ncbi:MAG: helix-turn-helix domain-containing protein [Bdellovibrionales bacterium]|nr:helix-turn-helix domain-containing protein [Bdellovibrionales bacterium]
MLKKKMVLKFILGLKIRQLRDKRNLSLKELGEVSGLSISYLNEIENGKKYPTIEKLAAIAQALKIDLGDLVSFKTGRNLHPLLKFLESDMMEVVPLELFGLSESDVMDLMGHDPEKFASFVLTILQVSRSFDIKMDDIYIAALKSFIEAHDNYFPEIEKIAKKMKSEWGFIEDEIKIDEIKAVLKKHYKYEIDEVTLGANKSLAMTRFLVKRSHPPVLYLNPKSKDTEKIFCIAKELGHLVLGTKKISGEQNLGEKLDDFKTSYFAGALLLEEKMFSKDLKQIFNHQKFEPDFFTKLLSKYNVSTEVLFHRLTQVLSANFKVNELFFLGVSTRLDVEESFEIYNELHLGQLHSPHAVHMNEKYCRRWVAIRNLKHLKENLHLENYLLGQISVALDGQKYFSLSLARKSSLDNQVLQSLTIGFLVNDELKNALKFLEDKNLKQISIGQTCQRCPKMDCLDRVAEPVIYHRDLELESQRKLISDLTK